jgi:general secretion pathway protein K
MRSRPPVPRRQRGVALITAVLIVALATILATQIGFDSALEQRRSSTTLLLDQAFLVGLGAEAWAASYLKDDRENSEQDHLGERWATPIPPIPIEGGTIEGFIEDMQGRFNLNELVTAEGAVSPEGLREFQNLLAALELESKWAGILADWLDSDTQPSFPDGAEDDLYTSQAPPYRAANGPITSVSELLALPGFDLERYRRLRPYVSALPIGTRINLCTAPGAVIDALSDGTKEFSVDPESLARQREERCFPTSEDLRAAFGDDAFNRIAGRVEEKSSFFRLTALVSIGTTQMSLYSLLQRDTSGVVRPILRSLGTE